MAELPTGNITFIFTDIEGSTRLWERYPAAMPAIIARHDLLVRTAIESQGGVVFRTGGDSFCAAFSCACAAATAALGAQRALDREQWHSHGMPPRHRLRVRFALLSSPVDLYNGEYGGQPLNRISRLLVAGHGGQILLANTTVQQLSGQLPCGATLIDMGTHQLKDLSEPEHIFQLAAPDLAADFPPLRTVEQLTHAQATPEPAETDAIADIAAWRQHKLPGMPGIDYEAVLKKDRELQRPRKQRASKDDSSNLF